MSVVKDPAIKLFGKTIKLPHEERGSDCASTAAEKLSTADDHRSSSATTTSREDNKKSSGSELAEVMQEDVSNNPVWEELTDPATSSGISDDPKETKLEKETSPAKSDKKQDSTDKGTSQEKTLKKPDKILPCPRCNSMDTKFCYYNNYKVNQPRHFCKNCQRYWTAGGTMRNVAVGSGRRKNKSSSTSYYRHIMVSEALQVARRDALKGIHDSTLNPNSTMLTFGSDALLCESMASALNIADKSQNFVGNGFHVPEQRLPASCGGRENGEDQSSASSITTSTSTEKGGNAGVHGSDLQTCQNFPGFPTPCFWSLGQWRPSMPPPAFNTGFPISFYPVPPYWSCTLPSPWNIPWVATSPASSDHSVLSTSPNSPTLGKHSRDGNMLNSANSGKEYRSEEKDSEQHVLIPKMLRTDNPSEAAKSSIWSTLGIKNDHIHSANGGNVFKAFQSKGDEKNHSVETSLVLRANPAALSRSLSFREST